MLRTIGTLALIGIVACAVFFAWIAYRLAVQYPQLNKRIEARAEQWNRENWETGTALLVRVQVTSNETLGNITNMAEVACFKKMFAWEGGLKGPPATNVAAKSIGPDYLNVPFGPNATHRTELRHLCSVALRESGEWQFPYVSDERYLYWSRIEPNDQSFSCFLGGDPRTNKGEVSRPTFLSAERISLKEILSEEKYAAIPERSDRRYVPVAKTRNWQQNRDKTEHFCWRRAPAYPCTEGVEQICGRPFR